MPSPYISTPNTDLDEILSSVCFGWSLGFVVLTGITAIKQTRRWSSYIFWCWTTMMACIPVALVDWLYVAGYIKLSFQLVFITTLLLCIQTWCLTQILVNRVCLLLHTPLERMRLQLSIIVCLIIFSSGLLIASSLTYFGDGVVGRDTEHWFTRALKIFRLLFDIGLNWYFIKTVKDRLVNHGLKKYEKLVTFTIRIIVVTLVIDALLIGALSYPNSLIPWMLHTASSLAKLQIEMTMSELIIAVAKALNRSSVELETPSIRKENQEENQCTNGSTASVGTQTPKGIDGISGSLSGSFQVKWTTGTTSVSTLELDPQKDRPTV